MLMMILIKINHSSQLVQEDHQGLIKKKILKIKDQIPKIKKKKKGLTQKIKKIKTLVPKKRNQRDLILKIKKEEKDQIQNKKVK